MKLGLDKTKNENVDGVSLEALEEAASVSEQATVESLQELDETLSKMDEADEVYQNIINLKSTLEQYSLDDALLSMINGTEQEGGIVCDLLEVSELPRVTDDNRQELSDKLSASLESKLSDAKDAVIKFLKELYDKLKEFAMKVVDMAKDNKKALQKKRDKIKKLESLPSSAIDEMMEVTNFVVYQEDGDDDQIQTSEQALHHIVGIIKDRFMYDAKEFSDYIASLQISIGEPMKENRNYWAILVEPVGTEKLAIRDLISARGGGVAEDGGASAMDNALRKSIELLDILKDLKGFDKQIEKMLKGQEDAMAKMAEKNFPGTEEIDLNTVKENGRLITRLVKSNMQSARRVVKMTDTAASITLKASK